MINKFSFIWWFRFAAFVLVTWKGQQVYGQKDSISYNSTCVNAKIQFNSTIFQRITFPQAVLWNFGDPGSGFYNTAGINFPTHAYSSPGLYKVSLMVVSAGDTTKIAGSISVVSPISYQFGPDIFLCEKGDTTLKAPSVAGATYQWTDDSLTTTQTLHVTKSGVYTVKINGCPVTDSIGVYFSSKPDPQLGDDHVLCAGEVLTLNAASQNAVYTWKLNGIVQQADTVAQLPVVAPGGQYIAIVSVPGCGVFSDTANITFATFAAPPFSLGPDTLLCPRQVYTLTASVAGATGYNWSTGSIDSTVQITQPGLYWAFVKVNNLCEVVDSVQVNYRGDKNLDFHDTAICKGMTLVLDADFGNGTYSWQAIPAQRDDQNQTGQSTYYVYKPGLYSITASVGNCVYKDSLKVSYNDSLDIKLDHDTLLCYGEPYTLHVTGNANTYTWQDGTTGAYYAVTDSGSYQVIAANGCGADTLTVKVGFHACVCSLHMPNAFTPNGDGINETFRPLHPCKMSDFRLDIFNRYGQLIFATKKPTLGWDGRIRGMPADMGTYVWMATYINSDTKKLTNAKGTVVLIR